MVSYLLWDSHYELTTYSMSQCILFYCPNYGYFRLDLQATFVLQEKMFTFHFDIVDLNTKCKKSVAIHLYELESTEPVNYY